jgi:hypothetical protein
MVPPNLLVRDTILVALKGKTLRWWRKRGMDVREIPRVLFLEFTHNVREKNGVPIGDIEELEGVILGLQEKRDTVCLRWWRGEEDVGEGHSCVFEIEAGIRYAGVWAAGSGQKLRESVVFRMGIGRWDLGQGTLVIAKILQRASELALSESFEPTTFWEKDRNPDRPYDRPPP